jgi:adenine-specific DNA-methyltransferase
MLSFALIVHLINPGRIHKTAELVAYETDPGLIPVCRQSLAYLKQWGTLNEIEILTELITEDFILHNADCFKPAGDLFSKPIMPFDIVVSNPPYFKLSIDNMRAIAAKVLTAINFLGQDNPLTCNNTAS